MQHKISIGVTTIKLVDHREVTSSRFPKFITELRSLRSLVIDRRVLTMPWHRNISEHIQKLPSTLRKLKIRVENSCHITSPPASTNASNSLSSDRHPTTNDLIHPKWTFASAFPHLETLELHSSSGSWQPYLALLPQSITSLTIPPCEKVIDETFSSLLPPDLLTLKLSAVGNISFPTFTPSFWSHLPSQLASLSIYSITESTCTAVLPRSLTQLNGIFSYPNLDLADLPSGLTNLSRTLVTNMSALTRSMFPNLREICIDSIDPQFLQSLPPTVHTIDADVISVSSVDQWPASLTKLSFRNAPDHIYAALLPSKLVKLSLSSVHNINTAVFSRLPRSLRHFKLRCQEIVESDSIDFPPHLTFLSLFDNKYRRATSIIRHLPASITNLKLTFSIPASLLKHLPPRLKALKTFNISGDYDWIPNTEAELAAMRMNFENGRRYGIVEREIDLVTRLKSASILALLPRTLTRLHITGDDKALDRLVWSAMPPNLSWLYWNPYGGLPLTLLRELSFKHMRTLNISLKNVQDEDLKLIPRHLQTAEIAFYNSPKLTFMAVQHVPAWVIPAIDGFITPLHRLTDLRLEHAKDEDSTYFLSLLDPDPAFLKTLLS